MVGGSGVNEGKVEYCEDRIWKTVCYDTWDRDETLVVCRQLGLPTQSKCIQITSIKLLKRKCSFAFLSVVTLQFEISREKFGPIILKDIQCTGNENSLSRCIHTDIEMEAHYCPSSAGVRCLAGKNDCPNQCVWRWD